VPVGERAPEIVLMVPGGRALVAPPPGSAHIQSGHSESDQIQGMSRRQLVIDVLLKHLPLAQAEGHPINTDIFAKPGLPNPVIDPSPTPTAFEPMTEPPNWKQAICADGSPWQQSAPLGQFYNGIDGPMPQTPDGMPRIRASIPDYYMATDTVRVSCPALRGQTVRLHVKSWTASFRVLGPVLFGPVDEIWEDQYQLRLDAGGNVSFPGVIVATAHVPPYPPPPHTTWAAIAAQEFTPPGSEGAYVEFQLYWGVAALIPTRWCHYYGAAPGQPRLTPF
jgi:hypothetical protein